MSEVISVAGLKPWTDPSAVPFLQINNVTKKFGEFTSVNNVSLEIYKGEIFCLLGGSGCGKSTLLRMLSGFEDLTSGQIIIDGQDQAGIPPYNRPTNMMFQSYALFPHMTVEKNIAYGLKRDGLPRAEIATRVTDMLSLVQMDAFAARKPHQLSGGQRQRVALARSLVKKPKLLLLDEPLGALDKKLREETQFELIKIQESLGVTFVVVTHDQQEAMTLSSRIGVMTEGESHVVVASPEAGLGIYVPHSISGVIGQKVAVAVRPEKMHISKGDLGDLRNKLSGTIDEIAYMGDSSVYQIRLDSGKRVRVNQSNLFRSEESSLTYGDRVNLGWAGNAGIVVTS